MWQNVRRSDGVLELRAPGKWREPQGHDAVWFDSSVPDVKISDHYNPDSSNEEFSDYGHLDNDDLDLMFGKANRKQIRELNLWNKPLVNVNVGESEREHEIRICPEFEPWMLEMKRRTRKLSLGALSVSNKRSKDFFNIYKKSDKYGFPSRSWDVYPDQINTVRSVSNSMPIKTRSYNLLHFELKGKSKKRLIRIYEETVFPEHKNGKRSAQRMLLDDRMVARAYRELLPGLTRPKSYEPYEPWHWRLDALRAPIAKRTGIDYEKVDSALCRLAKKWLKTLARIKNDWSRATFSVDIWQYHLASRDEDREKNYKSRLSHSEIYWMRVIWPRSNPEPSSYDADTTPTSVPMTLDASSHVAQERERWQDYRTPEINKLCWG